MLHLFLILVAIFLGVRKQYQIEGKAFVPLFKAGLRSGVIYAVITAILCYVYYAKIAPEIFELRNAALLENVPPGEDGAKQREQMETLLTPAKFAQGTFFGYFMISVLYSLLMTVFQTKILGRR